MTRGGAAALFLAALLASGCRTKAPPADTLVYFMDRDVEGLDPHASGQIWQTQTLLANLYDTLVALDPQMSLSPGLAESWSNPDERTWEFHLRDGIPFQTGGNLDAQDVAYSLLRARDHPRSVLRSTLADIVEVKALGRERVRVVTRAPDASLAARLREVYIVSRGFVEGRSEAALATQSAGTGAYVLAGRKAGVSVDLVRFERYWRGRPEVPRVRFVARPWGDPDARAFLGPTVETIFNLPPSTDAHRRALAEAVARFTPSVTITYLSFGMRGDDAPGVHGGAAGNPFRDARVRAAVARALDHEAVRAALGGEGFIPTQLVPPVVFGYDASLPPPKRELEEARRLLAETPWAQGFEVDLDLRQGNASYGPPIVQALEPLGIHVVPRVSPEEDYFARVTRGQSSMYVLRFSCRSGDAQELFDKWVHSRDDKRGFGTFNFSYDADPVEGLDAEIEGARRELNPPVRAVLLQKVMRRVMDAHLAIPLFNEKNETFTSKRVSWSPRADGFYLAAEVKLKP